MSSIANNVTSMLRVVKGFRHEIGVKNITSHPYLRFFQALPDQDFSLLLVNKNITAAPIIPAASELPMVIAKTAPVEIGPAAAGGNDVMPEGGAEVSPPGAPAVEKLPVTQSLIMFIALERTLQQ